MARRKDEPTEIDATGEAEAGGPLTAELVASRAELKRLQTALAEAQDAVLRRQADFENYRKRVERERTILTTAWLPTPRANCYQ
jgi:molecular chaperone GrpE